MPFDLNYTRHFLFGGFCVTFFENSYFFGCSIIEGKSLLPFCLLRYAHRLQQADHEGVFGAGIGHSIQTLI